MVDYVSTNALSMLGGDDYGDITAEIAALDASVVHKTGNLNETINGVKTFTSDFVINNANTDIISSVGANISAPVVYLNGTQNRVGSSLAVGSTSVGNKIDCVGGYNLITSSTTSTLANLIEATNGGSNGMTTTGAGNNVLNAQGTGKNFLISQTNNNEIQAGNANLMLIGTTEKLNMTSNTTTLTNSQININSTVGNNTISANSGRNYIQTLGGDNFITTNSGTNNMTVSSGTNTISSSRTSAYGNVIRALGTGGGNSMTTASGQNLIESGGGGANLIQCLGGSARNTIYTTGNSSTANFIDTFDGTGGNTIRASSGNNTISTTTGTNYIQSSGGDCEMRVTGGIGGVKLTATVGTNPYIGIYGKNIYYDTDNTHYIRTGASPGTVKIQVDGATTSLANATINLNGTTNVNGYLTATGGGGAITMISTAGGLYTNYYPEGLGAGRKAYVGFPNTASTDFNIINSYTDGAVNLGGRLKVGSRPFQWFITGGNANGTAFAGDAIGRAAAGGGLTSITAYGGAAGGSWNNITATFTAPTDGLYSIQLNLFQSQGNVVGRTVVLESAAIPGTGRQYMFFNSAQTTNEAAYQCSQTLWLTSGQTFRFVNDGPGSIQFYFGPTHTSLNIIRIY